MINDFLMIMVYTLAVNIAFGAICFAVQAIDFIFEKLWGNKDD